MNARIAVLPGDGVGPEVIDGALDVLHAVAAAYGHTLEVPRRAVGWEAMQRYGDPLPADTLHACRESDAVLLGAVGHPDADRLPAARRPEAGLLRLRRELGCYANLRPVRVFDPLVDLSALRPDLARGVDLVIVRELAGGIYYGEPRGAVAGMPRCAVNTERYDEREVERIARVAFELAGARRNRVASVDKSNVLETSELWRAVVTRVAADYPKVELRHVLVDRAAMELVLAPAQFDVILTSNLFGDILSDQAAAVAGSIGLLGSASLGDGPGLYEPVHGSAPDIAGRGRANPAGAIASVALLLRHSLGLAAEADAVEAALEATLAVLSTPDLARNAATASDTRTFARAVAARVAGTRPEEAHSAEAAWSR